MWNGMELFGLVWFGLVGKREGEESVKGRVFWSEGTVTNLRLSIGLDWIGLD